GAALCRPQCVVHPAAWLVRVVLCGGWGVLTVHRLLIRVCGRSPARLRPVVVCRPARADHPPTEPSSLYLLGHFISMLRAWNSPSAVAFPMSTMRSLRSKSCGLAMLSRTRAVSPLRSTMVKVVRLALMLGS